MNQNDSHNNLKDTQDSPEPPTAPSKFDKATFLTSKLKQGTKKLLNLDGHDDNESALSADNSECEASELFEDAAFNPQQVLEAAPHEPGSLRDKMHRGAHGLAATLKNPRRAMRSKYTRTVAENVSGKPEAYERRHDRELLDAYDELERANTRVEEPEYSRWEVSGSEDSIGDHEDGRFLDALSDPEDAVERDVEDAKARIRRVENLRKSLRSAWILGRHVRRVRVARPMTKPPVKSDFRRAAPDGQGKGDQWSSYLAQKALWYSRGFTPHHIDDFEELPFDLKDLTMTFERLAVVSAPWQSFLVQVRQVYLWEDRRRTTRFLLVYLVCWYFEYMMTAVFAWIIFGTIKNKLQPTRIETIRERVKRAEDEQAKAQAWGELIQQHGKQDWIEPLLDDIGPLLQLELSDLSNLLEIIQSFYRWEKPRQTWGALFFFFTCLLLGVLTDANFCLKLFWLGVGCIFFVSFPISARYPKYRKLVNPLYWIFWEIPNMAELAITQLQEKAVLRDVARLEKAKTAAAHAVDLQGLKDIRSNGFSEEGTPRDDAEILRAIRQNDQVTFRAVHSGSNTHGRLRLLRDGFWYYDKKMRLYYPYSRLCEIRKVDIVAANKSDASKTGRLIKRIQESTSLQFLPSGIEFFFLAAEQDSDERSLDPVKDDQQARKAEEQLALTVSESDRDKIVSLVISWSNLKWQPLFSLNTRNRLSHGAGNPSETGKGNKDLDNAIKSFVH